MAKEQKKLKSHSFSHYYLIAYNLIQSVGWSIMLLQYLLFYTNQKDNQSLYDSIKCSLLIFQNAAFLEILHTIFGIVKSNVGLTFAQVMSRIMVVAVIVCTKNTQQSFGLSLAILAWTITEIIRYLNYTFSLINVVPYFLKYLRYTTFIVLYPIGVTGELWCYWVAQKEIGDNNLFSLIMPNRFNFIFNCQHFVWFVMLLYIPLFPQLYLHMFSQRKKALGKPHIN